MLDRRNFLKSATATAALLMTKDRYANAAVSVQSGSPAGRREVRVGGLRVKTIDFHAHTEVEGIREMMGSKAMGARSTIGADRVRTMDAQGIDVEVLSINPFWYEITDRELARTLIKAQNEKLASSCAAHPGRFVGLASVALQHPELAAEQLEEGVKKLGLGGGSVGTSVGRDELASTRFDPFWAKADELGVPIFMHPQGVPELQARLQGNGDLVNVIGFPLATTIALSKLIFEGTLDRFPRLKICAAHGGGYLPAYPDRSDAGCLTFPERCPKKLKKLPTEYLKQLYFDSLVFTGEALRHLVAVAGASQIMVGTDHPFGPWTTTPVDHVLQTPGLNDADRIAILGGNAARLLNLPT